MKMGWAKYKLTSTVFDISKQAYAESVQSFLGQAEGANNGTSMS